MKTLIFSIVFFIIPIEPALAAPQISVENPIYDFDTVVQGEKVEHRFTIMNKGNEPLVIGQIHSSCGCTGVALSTKNIPAGKTGEIKVTFDSTNFAGKIIKSVAIDSNDSRHPSTVLTIQGRIVEIISPVPRTLNLGSLKAGSRKDVGLVLENKGNTPFSVITVSSPMSAIVGVAKDKNVNPGRSGKIAVTVTTPREGRFISGYLTVKTDNPRKQEIVIPVFATIIP